ncbi:hypothetical protein IWW48_001846 [Coemansia sp. RSA 1200]|nr:hypothetical protein IWW48_001846 [Coemansia sp. RSA 1200]
MRPLVPLQLLLGISSIPVSLSWPANRKIYDTGASLVNVPRIGFEKRQQVDIIDFSDAQSMHTVSALTLDTLHDHSSSDGIIVTLSVSDLGDSLATGSTGELTASETLQNPDVHVDTSQDSSTSPQSRSPTIMLSDDNTATALSSDTRQRVPETLVQDFSTNAINTDETAVPLPTLPNPTAVDTTSVETVDSETSAQAHDQDTSVLSSPDTPAETPTPAETTDNTSSAETTTTTTTTAAGSSDDGGNDLTTTDADAHTTELTSDTHPITSPDSHTTRVSNDTPTDVPTATGSKHTIVLTVTEYVDGTTSVSKITRTLDDDPDTTTAQENNDDKGGDDEDGKDNQPFTSTITVDGNVIVVTNTLPYSESDSSGSSFRGQMWGSGAYWSQRLVVHIAVVVCGAVLTAAAL